MAVKTRLGLVLSGPVKGEQLDSIDCNVNFCIYSIPPLVAGGKHDLDNQIQRFWDLDNLGIQGRCG